MTPLTASARLLLASSLSLVLSACGGGDGGNQIETPSVEPALLAAKLQMPVIAGARYRSCTERNECVSGLTDEQGRYEYIRDRPVSIRVGDIALFSTTGTERPGKTTDFSATSDESDPSFTNKMVLLYSLDADGDPDNGIQLSVHSHAAATLPTGVELDFSLSPSAFRDSPVLEQVVMTATLADQGLSLRPLDPLRVQETVRQAVFSGYYVASWKLRFDDATEKVYSVRPNGAVDSLDVSGEFTVQPTAAAELRFRKVDVTARTINGHLRMDGTGSGTWLDKNGASGRWSALRCPESDCASDR